MVAWKSYQVAPSSAFWQEDGKTYQIGISIESKLALVEAWVRSLKSKFAFEIVLVPQMQLAGFNRSYGYQPFRFAIAANGTAGQSNNNSPLSITLSGSDLNLHAWTLGDNSDNLATFTYNSVAMTLIQKPQYPTDRWSYQFISLTPATGTHNIATTGTTFNAVAGVSYTGCSQSSNPTAFNSATTTTGTVTSVGTTVGTTGSWVVGYLYGYSNSYTVDVGARRVNGTSGAATWDSNGSVSTGAFTVNFTSTIGSTGSVAAIMVLQPPVTGPTNVKTWDGITFSSVKTIEGVDVGSIKTVNGIS